MATLLFDTNIFIYHLNGSLSDRGTELLGRGLEGEGAYSVIAKIELLGFPQAQNAEQQARRLLAGLTQLPLRGCLKSSGRYQITPAA